MSNQHWYPEANKRSNPERFLADLLQILPKHLATRLAGFRKEHGARTFSAVPWWKFLDTCNNEEFEIIRKAVKQLELRVAPTFEGAPITNALTLAVLVAEGGRRYSDSDLGEPIPPGVWSQEPTSQEGDRE